MTFGITAQRRYRASGSVILSSGFHQSKNLAQNHSFWTMTQESFFRSYHARGMALADQRILGWDELERAAGIPIRPLFERFLGFVHLFSEIDRIVVSQMHQFYAIVWIHPKHDFIGFMFHDRVERLYYDRVKELLGVDTSDKRLHQIVYEDALPLCHSRVEVLFLQTRRFGRSSWSPSSMAPCVHQIDCVQRLTFYTWL